MESHIHSSPNSPSQALFWSLTANLISYSHSTCQRSPPGRASASIDPSKKGPERGLPKYWGAAKWTAVASSTLAWRETAAMPCHAMPSPQPQGTNSAQANPLPPPSASFALRERSTEAQTTPAWVSARLRLFSQVYGKWMAVFSCFIRPAHGKGKAGAGCAAGPPPGLPGAPSRLLRPSAPFPNGLQENYFTGQHL